MIPKRFSVLFALCVHLLAVLIAAPHAVRNRAVNDDAVIVEMIDAHRIPRKRLMPRRVVKRIEMPFTTPRVKALQVKQPIATAVKIQRTTPQFSLPVWNSRSRRSQAQTYASRDVDAKSKKERFGGAPMEVHRPKTASVIAKINAKRPRNSSIIDRIESTEIPEISPRPTPADP